MAETERSHLDEGQTRRGFATAFMKRNSGQSERRLGPRIWAIALAVVLVAAIALGIGFLAKPHAPAAAKPAASTAKHVPTTTLIPTSTTTLPSTVEGMPGVMPGSGSIAGAGALGGGGSGGLPGGDNFAAAQQPPAQAPAQPPQQPPATQTPQPYSETTGYGCPESAGLVFTQNGFYSEGNNGWLRLNSGGLNSGGCDADFDAMPMSGSASKDDASNSAVWQFKTGAVVTGTCMVSIWIPNVDSLIDVGGDPSTYQIFNSFTPSGTAPYQIEVNQVANRGRWASTSVRITNGALAVKLLSRGIDYNNSGPDYAHHAISAVHVSCTA